jgi:Virulence factor BrkB
MPPDGVCQPSGALSAFASRRKAFGKSDTKLRNLGQDCRVPCWPALYAIFGRRDLAQQDRAALGFSFAVSMVISLWSANAGISALFEVPTAVYEEKEKRSIVDAITLAFTGRTLILVLLSLVFLIVLPIVLGPLAHRGEPAELLKLVRWPILFVLTVLALSVNVQIRSEPQRAAMALDYLGQRFCRRGTARCLLSFLQVCREFRQLQQDLWLAWRDRRLYDLDMGLDHRRPRGSQARCGNGAWKGTRLGGRSTRSAPRRRDDGSDPLMAAMWLPALGRNQDAAHISSNRTRLAQCGRRKHQNSVALATHACANSKHPWLSIENR